MLLTKVPVSVIDGVRTPFQKISSGYEKLRSYDLARLALKGLKERADLSVHQPGVVTLGTVIANVATSNVARDAMLGAGYDDKIPAYTVTQACISANRAITNVADMIMLGQCDVGIAGGVDCMSDTPIRFRKAIQLRLLQSQRVRNPMGYLKLLKGLRFSDLLPELPAVAEFSTGLTMGADADRLAAEFNISRQSQDEFALRSHLNAARAWDEGWMDDEVLPVFIPPRCKPLNKDNTFRGDSSLEKLASLRPAFIKPHGTVTAGNASPLTDGAAVSLLMRAEYASSQGLDDSIRIKAYHYSAQNPDGELLLGPAYAIPHVLDECGLTLGDIDVIEFHEAFAGQVLANIAAMNSDHFNQLRLGRKKAFGLIDMDKTNAGGGSLSLGHPFGATGSRLLTTARNRLIREDGKFALIAACAAGGMASAIVLERVK